MHNEPDQEQPPIYIGATVIASPKDGDFEHEFMGIVVGKRGGRWIVTDADNNHF